MDRRRWNELLECSTTMQQVVAKAAHCQEVCVQFLPDALVRFVMYLRCRIVLAALTGTVRTRQNNRAARRPGIGSQVGIVLGAQTRLDFLVRRKILRAFLGMPLVLELVIEGWNGAALKPYCCDLGRNCVAGMTTPSALAVVGRTTICDSAQTQLTDLMCATVLCFNSRICFLLYRKVRQGSPEL